MVNGKLQPIFLGKEHERNCEPAILLLKVVHLKFDVYASEKTRYLANFSNSQDSVVWEQQNSKWWSGYTKTQKILRIFFIVFLTAVLFKYAKHKAQPMTWLYIFKRISWLIIDLYCLNDIIWITEWVCGQCWHANGLSVTQLWDYFGESFPLTIARTTAAQRRRWSGEQSGQPEDCVQHRRGIVFLVCLFRITFMSQNSKVRKILERASTMKVLWAMHPLDIFCDVKSCPSCSLSSN